MTPPQVVRVVVEVPKGGFVKRDAQGRVDYVSPLPSPFNYGAIPDLPSEDGEGLDALVLGGRRPRGWSGDVPVRARVRFLDCDQVDDKIVCSEHPVSRLERWAVVGFFIAYGWGKRLKRPSMRSGYGGWEWLDRNQEPEP